MIVIYICIHKVRFTFWHHLFLEFWLVNGWFFAHWPHQRAVTRLENVRQLNISSGKKLSLHIGNLYTSGQDIWDCSKVVVGRVRQVVILCSVNTTKYYLGGLVSGCYGEVVVLQRWSSRQVWPYYKYRYLRSA